MTATQPSPTEHFGSRALAWARAVTGLAPGRGSATKAEERAADFVQKELAGLGLMQVQRQGFQGLRSMGLFLALAAGQALVGHAAFWLLRVAGNWTAGLVCAAAFASSLYLFWRKFSFRDYPLRTSLPHGPSQNVIGILPPSGEARQKVVLVAHLDSHRAVWWYAADVLVRLYAAAAPLALYGLLAAPLLYLLALASGQMVFAWVAFPLALLHFGLWFTGMTADLGPYSPGANDNASAVGTLLALTERLRQQPLKQTEVWLAFTGCEETGCDGMLALLKQYGPQLKEALFLDFELVGIGERLIYLRSEGALPRRRISPEVERLLLEVGRPFDLQPRDVPSLGAYTECGVAWGQGFRAACIVAQRQDSDLLPEWHRLSDRPEHLSAVTLGRVHDLAWKVLERLDSRL